MWGAWYGAAPMLASRGLQAVTAVPAVARRTQYTAARPYSGRLPRSLRLAYKTVLRSQRHSPPHGDLPMSNAGSTSTPPRTHPISKTAIWVAAARAIGAREPDSKARNPDRLAEALLGDPAKLGLQHPIVDALRASYEQAM